MEVNVSVQFEQPVLLVCALFLHAKVVLDACPEMTLFLYHVTSALI